MKSAEDVWSIEVILAGSPVQAAVTLLRKREMLVLVDSGWPRTRKQLTAGLGARGIQPHQVTHILHTHLHIDHAANHPIFSNAVLMASRTEFQWADHLYRNLVHDENDVRFILSVFPRLANHALDRAVAFIQIARGICRQDFFYRWGEIRFYEDLGVPEGLEVLPLPGHTPGHCGILVSGSSSSSSVVAGDALTTEDSCLTRMPAIDPEQFEISRKKLRTFRGRIIPGHLPPFDQSS